MRTLGTILAGCLLVAAAGCQSAIEKEVKTLRDEKKQLQSQVEQAKSENEQLQKHVQLLLGLKPETKLEDIYSVRQINLGRYTGLYEKNKTGRKDTLIVYVQPVDQNGDAIKASGSVDVQLWDLSRKETESLLDEWHINPDEVKGLWVGTLMKYNYRLTFDVADKIEGLKDPLTVKVIFTDYLTGKAFTEQKVVKP